MTVSTRTDLLSVARWHAEDPSAWPFAPRFDPRQRWYDRLDTADDHEVWLLTWLPGQGTDLHDHGGSAGAFVVVSGVLTEDTVQRRPAAPAPRLAAGRRPALRRRTTCTASSTAAPARRSACTSTARR